MTRPAPTTARHGGVPAAAQCRRSDFQWCFPTTLSPGSSHEAGSAHNHVDQTAQRGTQQDRTASDATAYTPNRDRRVRRRQAFPWGYRTPPSRRDHRQRPPACPAHEVRSLDTGLACLAYLKPTMNCPGPAEAPTRAKMRPLDPQSGRYAGLQVVTFTSRRAPSPCAVTLCASRTGTRRRRADRAIPRTIIVACGRSAGWGVCDPHRCCARRCVSSPARSRPGVCGFRAAASRPCRLFRSPPCTRRRTWLRYPR